MLSLGAAFQALSTDRLGGLWLGLAKGAPSATTLKGWDLEHKGAFVANEAAEKEDAATSCTRDRKLSRSTK